MQTKTGQTQSKSLCESAPSRTPWEEIKDKIAVIQIVMSL